MADSQKADAAASFGLVLKSIPFLDRHLAFPLVNHFDAEAFPEVTRIKFELLKPTNMTDFIGELDAKLQGAKEVPKEYETKREAVFQRQDDLAQASAEASALLRNPEIISNLRSDKVANLTYLKENFNVTLEMINTLYDYGQFLYSLGQYADAAEYLYQFRILSTDTDKVASATWGKLACEILSGEWQSAVEEVQKVRESIESRAGGAPLSQLTQRAWLLHWSLFPLFNHDGGREALTELFFSPNYMNAVQTLCPWLLRYLIVAVVINRSRGRNSNNYQKNFKELVRIVKAEQYQYTDGVTQFIKALYLDYDFEEAQQKLTDIAEGASGDFFLEGVIDDFVDSARYLISESYCKIHQRIDIKDLCTRLGLSQDDGEKWIVNLIRDSRMDAKIDYKEGTVIMNHPPQSVYQQIIERTKGGFFRTQVLNSAVSKQ